MLDKIKRFLSRSKVNNSGTEKQNREHNLGVATCALFVEMAKIDGTFTQEELETILSILKDKYGVSGEHADTLIEEADKELDQSVDLWQFARLINENYSTDEKIEIVETLWQIVYVDGKMDQYEHYLMNKLKNLLRLSHNQLIDTKLKVKYSRGI